MSFFLWYTYYGEKHDFKCKWPTDIVAFYSEWFINRYQEGFVDVRNPFNPNLISRIFFFDVDLILFCTKNPEPILEFLPKITHPIQFHITITPYKKDIEPFVPDKKRVIEHVKKIAQIIGKENVFVRYDPIFLSERYTIAYHQKAFERLCSLLNGSVQKIIVSFIDDYRNVRNNEQVLNRKEFTEKDYQQLGLSFSESARKNNMTVQTCFEERTLTEYGFVKGECLSKEAAYKITGKTYPSWKARKCGCVQMVDIGFYNTCSHLCKYCYANYEEKTVQKNRQLHDVNSSLLIGSLQPTDVIKIRKK